MQKYFIKYFVDVIEDSFNDGELKQVNYYDGEFFIEAANSKVAIKKLFEDKLYFDIDLNNLESLQDDNLNGYFYSVLCDVNNEQITNKECQDFKEWEKGNINLCANRVNFNIYELNEIKNLDSID